MRSVRFGNLIICKHVFDNYADRFPHLGEFDFDDRNQRITVARHIKEMLDDSVHVLRDEQSIFVYLWSNEMRGIAYPAEIGETLTKIVTSYPAGTSLVNKALSLRDQCQDQCQSKKNHKASVKVAAT